MCFPSQWIRRRSELATTPLPDVLQISADELHKSTAQADATPPIVAPPLDVAGEGKG